MLPDAFVQALVVPVEAHVAVAVVDDSQQPEAREPIGIDHSSLVDRSHRTAALRCHQHTVPLHAARTGLAESGDHPAADGPGQLAPQARERIVRVDRKFLERLAQLLQ